MTDYEKKELKVIEDIAATIDKLDHNLDELSQLESDPKKHSVKTWYYEKKALHEIKKCLHAADKYEKYDEKEFDKVEREFEKLLEL